MNLLHRPVRTRLGDGFAVDVARNNSLILCMINIRGSFMSRHFNTEDVLFLDTNRRGDEELAAMNKKSVRSGAKIDYEFEGDKNYNIIVNEFLEIDNLMDNALAILQRINYLASRTSQFGKINLTIKLLGKSIDLIKNHIRINYRLNV